MSKSLEENIEGAIMDEFSLQDTFRMLVREHSMSPAEAKNYLLDCFTSQSFDLYRDREVNGKVYFEPADIRDLSDFESVPARFTFLTRHKKRIQ